MGAGVEQAGRVSEWFWTVSRSGGGVGGDGDEESSALTDVGKSGVPDFVFGHATGRVVEDVDDERFEG